MMLIKDMTYEIIIYLISNGADQANCQKDYGESTAQGSISCPEGLSFVKPGSSLSSPPG